MILRLSLPKIRLAWREQANSVASGESNDSEAAEQPADPADVGPGQSDRLIGPRRADLAGVGCRSGSMATVRARALADDR